MRGAHPTGTPGSILAWGRRLPPPVAPAEAWIALELQGVTGTETLMRWSVDATKAGESWGAEVLDVAEEDAQGRGQLTEYALTYRVNGEPVATKAVRRGAGSAGAEALRLASPEDVINRLVAQNEALHRMMLQSAAQTTAIQQQLLTAMAARVRELEEERTSTLDLHADALRALHAAEDATRDDGAEDRSAKRLERVIGVGMMALAKDNPALQQLAPVALQLIQGGNDGGE